MAAVTQPSMQYVCGLSPAPAETPAKAPEQAVSYSVQTPTKVDARSSRPSVVSSGQENLMHKFEVKNTFIHYGSPLKTVSVVTPPKTVPCNFAPEMLLWEQQPRLRTPAAVFHAAATPSTAGGALAGGAQYYLAPPAPPLPALAVVAAPANPSTLLRLSDFLPSPAAAGGMVGGMAQTNTQVLPAGVSCAWQQQQQPCGFEGMPQVPPLPGPPCQAPSSAASGPQMPPPPPPPPQFSAFDLMASMQVPAGSYDAMQYMTGEASMSSVSSYDQSRMHSQHMHQMPQMPPQMPLQHAPTLPLEHCGQSYQLSSQCGVSPMNAMGGPSPTANGMYCMNPSMSVMSMGGSTPMNMAGPSPMAGMVGTGPACGTVTAESCLGSFCMGNPAAGTCASGQMPMQLSSATMPGMTGPSAMTVSISAANFPEPGSAQVHMSQQSDDMPRLTSENMDMTWGI